MLVWDFMGVETTHFQGMEAEIMGSGGGDNGQGAGGLWSLECYCSVSTVQCSIYYTRYT